MALDVEAGPLWIGNVWSTFSTMPQTTLIRSGGKMYAYSFTTGVKPIEPKVRLTDDAIQALCLWLVNQSRIEEADALLEKYYPRK